MLFLPQNNPVIFRLQVKSFDPSEFMDQEGKKALIRLEIDEFKIALLVSENTIDDAFYFSNELNQVGKKSLDEMLRLSLVRGSIITIDRLNEKLLEFYKTLLFSFIEIPNISTNFISFWRFVQTQRENGNSGVAIITNEEISFYAVFKSGALLGGWKAFATNVPSQELSPEKTLDISAKTSGEFSYYKTFQQVSIDIDQDFTMQMKTEFGSIYQIDHPNHRKIFEIFKETGIELSSLLVSGATIQQIAQNTREPILKIVELAKLLIRLDVAQKK